MQMTQDDIAAEDKLIEDMAAHIRKFAAYMPGSEGYTEALIAAVVDTKLMGALDKDNDPEFIDTRIRALEGKLKTWRKRKEALSHAQSPVCKCNKCRYAAGDDEVVL